MDSTNQEFSGEYGFAETESWWKLNHMVAPKADALKCVACHGDDSRMDWAALGYDGDPEHKTGISRFELSEAYEN